MLIQSLQSQLNSVLISSGGGLICSWPRRFASSSGMSMSRFGLNLFGGGAAHTVGHEKRGLGFRHATMANGILQAAGRRAGSRNFGPLKAKRRRCDKSVPSDVRRRFPTRTQGAHVLRSSGDAVQVRFRRLSISRSFPSPAAALIEEWQLQNASIAQKMQMRCATLLGFDSAVDLALEPMRLNRPQMRADFR